MSVFSENPSLNRRIDDDSEPYSGQEDSFHLEDDMDEIHNSL